MGKKKKKNQKDENRKEKGRPDFAERDDARLMTDMIAKMAGNEVTDSKFFGWEPGMKMLYCDILLRLYFSDRYYEAVEIIDLIFYILNMNDTGKVVAVAAAGASEDNCKAFLDKYYERISYININLYEKLGYKTYRIEKGDRNLSFAYMRKTIDQTNSSL